MQVFHAFDNAGGPDPDALSHGEGWIGFGWNDPMYGKEGLTIDLDGFCSRNMPIRSGTGLLRYVLNRDSITLYFTPELAGKLALDEVITIRFEISDEQFANLEAGMESVAAYGGDRGGIWSKRTE